MSDLISRQAVLAIIEREEFKGDAIAEIEKLPSVENKGEWIIYGFPSSEQIKNCTEDYYCSECKFVVSRFESRACNFCPNCGADMRKAEKPETCKGCLEPCIMYEPDMRACKKKVTDRNEKGE